MSKYYKHKSDKVIVEWAREVDEDTFKAKVIVNDTRCAIGEVFTCHYVDFEPYELNTETLSNDNPNKVEVGDKDINLRLECLKLAVKLNEIEGSSAETCTLEAQEFYDWITKKG